MPKKTINSPVANSDRPRDQGQSRKSAVLRAQKITEMLDATTARRLISQARRENNVDNA